MALHRHNGLLLLALVVVITSFSEDINSFFKVDRSYSSIVLPNNVSSHDEFTSSGSPRTVSLKESPTPSFSPTDNPSASPPTGETAHSSRTSGCLNRVFYDKLPALIAKLNSDPNGLALQPLLLNYTVNETGETLVEPIDGLNLTVLHGRRMAMLGDSTLFYPHKFLYQLMVKQNARWQAFISSALYNATLNDGNALLYEKEPWMNFSSGITGSRFSPPAPISLHNGRTVVEWVGMSGIANKDLEQRLRTMHAGARRIKPNVVVANMGLHWLHICAFKEAPKIASIPPPTMVANVERVVYYEEWLQSIIDTAQEVNASLLLFKTTNFINASARTGPWEKLEKQLRKFDPKDINRCMVLVHKVVEQNYRGVADKQTEQRNMTDAQIKEYCQYSQFTEVGSRYLNGRLQAFVKEYNKHDKNHISTSSPMAVGIFDDHDLEMNAGTADAIHHPTVALLRLRFLINAIQSYEECIHVPENVIK